jgi:hypothetical protein
MSESMKTGEDYSLLDSVLFMFGDDRFPKLAVTHREQFQSAGPFKHAVIDNFLPAAVARHIYEYYPNVDDKIVHHDNENTSRKLQQDVANMHPYVRAFSAALASREFLLFLETLTGVECLIPDPYLFGGGAMISEKGDFLNIHQDFNWYFQLQLHRRVNALIYLTPDWKSEYGGDLELWDETQCVHKIAPLFNRLVVFATPGANHGQPDKLDTPEDIKRRVFSVFYYTSRPSDETWDDPHFTKYLPNNFQLGVKMKDDYVTRGREY